MRVPSARQSAVVLFLLTVPTLLHAQNNGEAATDTTLTSEDTASSASISGNYSNYSTVAEKAYAVLMNRLPRPAVPHLDPIKVRDAMSNQTYVSNFTFVIGHRGFHSAPGCPENSACALAAAFDAGADATEFDVKLTGQDSNGNVGVVFGHDYTVGREQGNWFSKNISGNWDIFAAFPNPDPAYTNGTITSPFGINFNGNNDPGQNDKRFLLTEAQQAGSPWTLRDTFGTTIPNQYELNLYQYLYLAQKYFPVMPWLDIKSKTDLIEVGKVIQQAQTDFAANAVGASNGASGPIHAVAFKLGPSVLLGSPNDQLNGVTVPFSSRVGYNGGSVRKLLGINDVSYFFVWSLAANGDGTYSITNQYNPSLNLQLDISGSSTAIAARVVQTTASNVTSQRWFIQPVVSPDDTLDSTSAQRPGMPLNLAYLSQATSISVSCMPPAYTANSNLSYTLGWYLNGHLVNSAAISPGTPYTISNLNPSTRYTIAITANASGNTGPQASVLVTTKAQ